jgi:hypothetical protein
MSSVLQVRYVRIRTRDGWQDPYDLDEPVVAIVGPVDTGKSSLVDCIAFALGRDSDEFRGTVDIHLREVEIGIRVNSGSYILRRSRKTSSYVDVLDAGRTSIGRFPLKPQNDEQSLSSWLLEQLDLDDYFSSVRLAGGKALDFANSLLPYCYLTQDDIDRHIIRAPRDDAARLVTLKLLLNLTTPEYERLTAAIHDTENTIEKQRRQIGVVKTFLSGSSATDPDILDKEIKDLALAKEAAAARLATWRSDAHAAARLAEHEQRKIDAARGALREAETYLDQSRRTYDRTLSTIKECEEAVASLDRLEERIANRPLKLHAALTMCPICSSDIADRPVVSGCCYLCGEDLTGSCHARERERLRVKLSVAQEQEERFRPEVAEAAVRTKSAADALSDLLAEVDGHSRDSVTPFVDAIATASAELAGIDARLAALTGFQRGSERLNEQLRQVEDLEARQEDERAKARQHAAGLERADDVLTALNAIFQGIVHGISLPHATGQARLDADSLLPLVDEQKFSQRGGGAKSAVSIAYSLSLLTYTLHNALSRLPSLLIIDSPRKNFGSNRDDQQLAHRVYERFLDHMEFLKDMPDKFHRPFQLVIIDNDIHPDIRKRVKVHEFKHDQGFIRNLPEPHGHAEATVQLSLEGEADGWPEPRIQR